MSTDRKKKEQVHTVAVENYTDAIDFTSSTFGNTQEGGFKSYLVHPTVAQLREMFSSFQELVEFGNWPVSKIIQREISKERAEEIAETYLLSNEIKYFPPLTCVIFPISVNNSPYDNYSNISEEEKNEAKLYFQDKVKDTNYEVPESPFGGCYISNFDFLSGKIFWNKTNCLAIMIDGQHRREALIEAAKKNRKINSWSVPVNILRVDEFCKDSGRTVSDVTRDIFLSINKTPKQVDPSRIILMDDRDLSAIFVQGLVDDENANVPIKPEWVDWHSEDGKFASEYLTGIIPLYHLISFALMNGKGLEGIEPFGNKSKVQSFVNKITNALFVDEMIEQQSLDPNIYSAKRLLEEWININSVVELGPIEDNDERYVDKLFSLPFEVRSKYSERFLNLYGHTFNRVFLELGTFKDHLRILEMNGLKSKNSKLVKHLRSTLQVKDENRAKDVTIIKLIADLNSNKKQKIFHTVMGQKAIFKFLFDSVVEVKAVNSTNIHDFLNKKIDSLLKVEELLSKNGLDVFDFNIKKIPKNIQDEEGDAYKKLMSNFWEGIIVKQTGEIDYAKASINCLVNILETIEEWFNGDYDAVPTYRSTIISRHDKILATLITDKRIKTSVKAEEIVDFKIKFLFDLFDKIKK